ncbi:enoyl-CoA hydratase-related protein [Actinomycetota bacterium]|nr:enoyl-CoA hydratase-related protein [Actinomycetota bacterium]
MSAEADRKMVGEELLVSEYIQVELQESTAIIHLRRPPMNALNLQMQREIAAAATLVSGRVGIDAVVLYGGEKVFAAGADVKEMANMTYSDMSSAAHSLQSAFDTVAKISQPTIAAVAGFALGGGLELAMCADFRVAGDNTKLGQPEITLGIIPGAGGTQRLPRLIGGSKAKELVFGGHMISAARALEIGLVNQVVEPGQVLSAALTWANRFAGGPKIALAAAKRAIDNGANVDLRSGLSIESTEFAALFGTEDQKNGMKSFVNDGPGKATFVGR